MRAGELTMRLDTPSDANLAGLGTVMSGKTRGSLPSLLAGGGIVERADIDESLEREEQSG